MSAPLSERIVAALDANKGVLLPAIQSLMEEAWNEGGTAAIEREHTYGREEKAKFSNPYTWEPKPEPVRPREEQPMWRGDREYRQAQWDHARTPERYGGGLG